MTLDRKYATIVKRLRRRYKFLEDVTIDVVEGYGLSGVTCYTPETRTIYVDLKTVRRLHNTPRYKRRFGKNLSFDNFALHIILHEFAHVKQFDIIPNHRLYVTPADRSSTAPAAGCRSPCRCGVRCRAPSRSGRRSSEQKTG